MLEIFKYSSPYTYLKDACEEKKKINPSFSIRSWARNLGLKSHASLNQMLQGKRSIPKKHIPNFIKSLNLSTNEAIFFETLVSLGNAKNLNEKEFYYSKLKSISPKKAPQLNMLQIESFKYLKEPIHTIILEMSDLKDFDPDPKWIKKRLNFDISLNEISDATDRLLGSEPHGRR